MKNTSTQNLLLRKLYGELNDREQEMLNERLAENWQLIEDLEAFGEVVKQLDAQKYSPSNTSVQLILKHSRKTAPVVSTF